MGRTEGRLSGQRGGLGGGDERGGGGPARAPGRGGRVGAGARARREAAWRPRRHEAAASFRLLWQETFVGLKVQGDQVLSGGLGLRKTYSESPPFLFVLLCFRIEFFSAFESK